MKPYSLIYKYQRFGETCCLHLQNRSMITMNMGYVSAKWQCLSTKPHGINIRNIIIL